MLTRFIVEQSHRRHDSTRTGCVQSEDAKSGGFLSCEAAAYDSPGRESQGRAESTSWTYPMPVLPPCFPCPPLSSPTLCRLTTYAASLLVNSVILC